MNFYCNKTHRENERYTSLSVIFLDSIVNVDKKTLSTNIFKRM